MSRAHDLKMGQKRVYRERGRTDTPSVHYGHADRRPPWVPGWAEALTPEHSEWPAGLDAKIHRVWIDRETGRVFRWRHDDIVRRDRLRYLITHMPDDVTPDARRELAALEASVAARLEGRFIPKRERTDAELLAQREKARKDNLRVKARFAAALARKKGGAA